MLLIAKVHLFESRTYYLAFTIDSSILQNVEADGAVVVRK